MRILAVSLKYNRPDMFSHLVSFGVQAEGAGHSVSYILSAHCRWLVEELGTRLDAVFLGRSNDARNMVLDTLAFHTTGRPRIRSIFKRLRPDVLFFGNMHPANALLAAIARSEGSKEVWWWLHEPHTQEKKRHGRCRRYYITLVEHLQGRFLRHVDHVLLSSDEAMHQFREHYSWYRGKVTHVPLIFLDYYEPDRPSSPEYITFVGNAVPAKGIDTFLALVEYAESHGSSLQFQIVTGSDVRGMLPSLSSTARQRLQVVSGNRLSDLQLGRAVRESLAVIAPYRRVTQSGVVPVAFMHGVPVISSNTGAMPESIRPGETGALLPSDAQLNDWLDAVETIRENREQMGSRCRQFYEDHYSPKNWQKVFPSLFEGLEN